MQISKDTAKLLNESGDMSARETLKKVQNHLSKPWNQNYEHEVSFHFCGLTKRVYATVAGQFC